MQAAGAFDVPAMEQILGPGSEDLVASEDTVRDKNIALAFAAIAKEKNSVVVDPKNAGPCHSRGRKRRLAVADPRRKEEW